MEYSNKKNLNEVHGIKSLANIFLLSYMFTLLVSCTEHSKQSPQDCKIDEYTIAKWTVYKLNTLNADGWLHNPIDPYFTRQSDRFLLDSVKTITMDLEIHSIEPRHYHISDKMTKSYCLGFEKGYTVNLIKYIPFSGVCIDTTNRKIMYALVDNARITYSDIDYTQDSLFCSYLRNDWQNCNPWLKEKYECFCRK